MEHAVRKFSKDPRAIKWFVTKGIYTSCHDLITRILQMDCDGDQLNVVTNKEIIDAAKRTIEKLDVVPLFYDGTKAPPEILSIENLFNGVKRAHDYSGIGVYSNMITRLWNKDNPDAMAAALICKTNNYTIDAAKTGFLSSYEDFPEPKKKVNKAIGGKTGAMPWFFQFSKNGRHCPNGIKQKKKKYLKPNNSVMNKIYARFTDIGNINMNYAGVAPFNWMMLLKEFPKKMNEKAVLLFCDMDNANLSNVLRSFDENDFDQKEKIKGYDIVKEAITDELIEQFGSLEEIYPSIVKYLFVGENADKQSHKQMFWRVFGEIALSILKKNLENYSVCDNCNMKVPAWYKKHECNGFTKGFFTCIDCGTICIRNNSRQVRCTHCQDEYRTMRKRQERNKAYMMKRTG